MSVVPVKSDLKIYMDDMEISGLKSLGVEEFRTEKYAREFLNSNAFDIVPVDNKYIITLEYYAAKPFLYGDKFSITVECENSSVIYNNCFIKSTSEFYSNGKLICKVKIISTEKE